MPPKLNNTSMASNTPRRSHPSPHSWHIHGILYLIDGHFWLKSSLYYLLHNIQQHVILNTYYLILNFMSSLIEIYDHFQREAQNHLWTFIASLIEIYDHFQREAQIHLWTFMASLMIIFDQKKREAQNRRTFIFHWYHFRLIEKSFALFGIQ